ncbi:PDR/VanB family oxidoreductase [Komagataeibacter sp. FXV3]|uniref:PDR/VanB family oxidoreductase n=1 Tax=Komagataeibacter sp. FXV3 TaxID=2608998 RepID=UPI00187B1ABB|nr:PDR/VanB family oxidoreductase [Komagataeibacter sp. FXV3]MBE7728295.1 oxidoreductase [Komagataeibacter sp. FXV3]
MAFTDPAAPDGTIPVRLTTITFGARDLWTFTLEAPDGNPLPPATPGAHIDLHLPDGTVRQYSLLSTRPYTIGVKREAEGRGASRWLHDHARVGMIFAISPPRNAFALREDAAHTVLLAGGVGITPLLPMYERLRKLERSVHLHYWCRSREHALFVGRLEQRPDVTLHFGDATRPRLVDVVGNIVAGSEIYCCGPERMLAELALATAGFPPETVHVERFHAAPMQGDETGGDAFTLVLARSGRELHVPADRSVLEVVTEAGIDVPYSCEEGICGACETIVLEGQPLHRDSVRSAQLHDSRGRMIICCSRSRTPRLVLDL